MAGYSGTPLAKKLGLKSGYKACVIHPPGNYWDLLDPLPDKITWVSSRASSIDLVHLFAADLATLEKLLPKLKNRIKSNGMIWISWYKKSSKIPTDVSEDQIRATAFPLGMVDVKVCAVDQKWSGLKVVIRKENR